MSRTRSLLRLLVLRVWVLEESWAELENYFCMRKENILKQLTEMLIDDNDISRKINVFCKQVEKNEKNKKLNAQRLERPH